MHSTFSTTATGPEAGAETLTHQPWNPEVTIRICSDELTIDTPSVVNTAGGCGVEGGLFDPGLYALLVQRRPIGRLLGSTGAHGDKIREVVARPGELTFIVATGDPTADPFVNAYRMLPTLLGIAGVVH